MNQLPCIKNKCITFPVCRNKELIYCSELRYHCFNIVRIREKQNDIWAELHEVFPNISGLMIDKTLFKQETDELLKEQSK